MSIICPDCAHENPADSEFCALCGAELSTASAVPRPVPDDTIIIGKPDFEYSSTPDPVAPIVDSIPEPFVSPTPTYPAPAATSTSATARLVAKKQGVQTPEFDLESSNLVGKFDPDMGPVEVDLANFPNADNISRQHAEIYREGDQWKVKDIGSENGVFLKRVGQTRFSARITTPEILNTGDEITFANINFIFQSP